MPADDAAPALPPPHLRMGGEHFMDDAQFVEAASADVVRLQQLARLTSDSRLLDWGCGAGRLAVGVHHVLGHVAEYHGVDVQEPLITWARENLSDDHTRFSLVDVANARYNPEGSPAPSIPADVGSVDVFYAYSVWSHMTPDDVVAYARIIRDLLAPQGRAMLTAFVEEEVESWRANPVGYGPLKWQGALHCVRYERQFLEALMAECGLDILQLSHGTETDGQSMLLLEASG